MDQGEERRFSIRIRLAYPARLWGMDADGRALREDTQLENLSTGGLYLRLTRSIPNGSRVFVAARLSTASLEQVPALRLAARGVVLRTEPQPDGTCGVAVQFTRRRVL